MSLDEIKAMEGSVDVHMNLGRLSGGGPLYWARIPGFSPKSQKMIVMLRDVGVDYPMGRTVRDLLEWDTQWKDLVQARVHAVMGKLGVAELDLKSLKLEEDKVDGEDAVEAA
jgi:hypothetical protein